jgi:hypothetical protein
MDFPLSGTERGVDLDVMRQSTITEILELGEMLFDTAIDAAAQRSTEGEEDDASLIEDMRVAAEDFFTALRLLLVAEQDKN